ncbi:MAG TPA: hypothetical protein VN081_04475 [Dongiaceae bacterium]|nr:hypothetical protein [Dongiaceae bacterium]
MINKRQIRRHYQRQNRQDCGSKIAFNSRREAAEYNNRPMTHIGNRRKEKLHVYKCLNCGKFHLGHEFRKKQFH